MNTEYNIASKFLEAILLLIELWPYNPIGFPQWDSVEYGSRFYAPLGLNPTGCRKGAGRYAVGYISCGGLRDVTEL